MSIETPKIGIIPATAVLYKEIGRKLSQMLNGDFFIKEGLDAIEEVMSENIYPKNKVVEISLDSFLSSLKKELPEEYNEKLDIFVNGYLGDGKYFSKSKKEGKIVRFPEHTTLSPEMQTVIRSTPIVWGDWTLPDLFPVYGSIFYPKRKNV